MSEIRKHYFLDEYCIIASERGKRPSDFKAAGNVEKGEAQGAGAISQVPDIVSGCFFCYGNESKTPAATAVYKQGKIFIDTNTERESGWDVRCFPNLFPAVSPNNITPDTAPPADISDNLASGYGFHEIIVESPKHGMSLSGLDDDKMELLMRVYRDRVTFYQAQEAIEFVSLFKNQGKSAGASLSHTHTQLVALPMVPPALKRELAAIKNAAEGASACPYCDIVSAESESERLLAKNSHFIAIAPYYSTAPFEIWILPVEHSSHIAGFDDSALDSLASILKEMLARLDTALSNPPYNYMFHQMMDEDYHFNLRIQPALATIAGFEKNTGIYINSVVPEQVATFI